jgi:hypothetical protein
MALLFIIMLVDTDSIDPQTSRLVPISQPSQAGGKVLSDITLTIREMDSLHSRTPAI